VGDRFQIPNDSRELRYAWDPFVAKLRRLSSEPGEYSETYAAQLKALELMKSIDLMGFDDRMFVACFTQLRDVVSQWSRYSANGHGIALGYDANAIQALRVPIFHHAAGGRLLPAMALVADSVPPASHDRQMAVNLGSGRRRCSCAPARPPRRGDPVASAAL
jgi:hypothetical protein